MTALRRTLLGLAVASFALTGCSSENDKPQTVPISGQITLDGAPLEGAEVNYFSPRSSFLSTGMTNEDGFYQLYAGAAPGENKVWISKDTSKTDVSPVGSDPAENPEADIVQLQAAAGTEAVAEVKGEQLPSKFSDPDKSILKYNVTENGTQTADFNLTKQ